MREVGVRVQQEKGKARGGRLAVFVGVGGLCHRNYHHHRSRLVSLELGVHLGSAVQGKSRGGRGEISCQQRGTLAGGAQEHHYYNRSRIEMSVWLKSCISTLLCSNGCPLCCKQTYIERANSKNKKPCLKKKL